MELIDLKIIVKDSLADSVPLDVFNILPEEEGRHLLVTTLQWPPAFDQNIALRKATAQRNCA